MMLMRSILQKWFPCMTNLWGHKGLVTAPHQGTVNQDPGGNPEWHLWIVAFSFQFCITIPRFLPSNTVSGGRSSENCKIMLGEERGWLNVAACCLPAATPPLGNLLANLGLGIKWARIYCKCCSCYQWHVGGLMLINWLVPMLYRG